MPELELPTMKVLTVRQPWAWAIIYAGKWIENRGKRTWYKGTVAIHASKWWNEKQVLQLFQENPGLRQYVRNNHMPLMDALKFQCGKIIGTAELSECCYSENQRVCIGGSRLRIGDSPWYVGPWAWVLTDTARCLGDYIEHSGGLAMTDLPEEKVKRLLASVRDE